jgi:hypothetical protein
MCGETERMHRELALVRIVYNWNTILRCEFFGTLPVMGCYGVHDDLSVHFGGNG